MASITMVEFLREINVSTTEGRYITCPLCERENKAKVSKYSIKCYHPSCKAADGLNLSQLADILIKEGRLSKDKAPNDYSPEDALRRSNLLATVLDLGTNTTIDREVVDWLSDRQLLDVDLSYIPLNYNLQAELRQRGFSDEEIDILPSFQNRILFPLRNPYTGSITHLMGRHMGQSDLRWLSTKKDKSVRSNTSYLFNLENLRDEKIIYLCEGITDCISLLQVGLPAAAYMGVAPSLSWLGSILKNKTLVFIADSDKYNINSNLTGYKSWKTLIKSIVELYISCEGQVDIHCCKWVYRLKIKDINDALKEGWSDDEIINAVQKTIPLHSMVIELALLKDCNSELISKVAQYQENNSVYESLSQLSKESLINLLLNG